MNYKNIYNKIVEKAISLNRKKKNGEYYESHHIIPKCIGGEDIANNKVLLTAKEHYVCHHLLTYIYPSDNSIWFAFWSMVNRKSNKQERYKCSARVYEKARNKIKEIQSKKWKDNNPNNNRSNVGKSNPMYGSKRFGEKNPFYKKTHSEESRAKISKSNKGKTGFHRSRKVLINDILYPTLTQASKELKVSTACIFNRINNKNFKEYKYYESNMEK